METKIFTKIHATLETLFIIAFSSSPVAGKPVSINSIYSKWNKHKWNCHRIHAALRGQSVEFIFGNDVPRNVPSLVGPTESTGRRWKGLRKHGEEGGWGGDDGSPLPHSVLHHAHKPTKTHKWNISRNTYGSRARNLTPILRKHSSASNYCCQAAWLARAHMPAFHFRKF